MSRNKELSALWREATKIEGLIGGIKSKLSFMYNYGISFPPIESIERQMRSAEDHLHKLFDEVANLYEIPTPCPTLKEAAAAQKQQEEPKVMNVQYLRKLEADGDITLTEKKFVTPKMSLFVTKRVSEAGMNIIRSYIQLYPGDNRLLQLGRAYKYSNNYTLSIGGYKSDGAAHLLNYKIRVRVDNSSEGWMSVNDFRNNHGNQFKSGFLTLVGGLYE